MFTLTINLNKEQNDLITATAAIQGKTTEQFMIETVIDAIEDNADKIELLEAKAEFKKNPKTYTHDNVMKMFDVK